MSETTLKRLAGVLVVAVALWGGLRLISSTGGAEPDAPRELVDALALLSDDEPGARVVRLRNPDGTALELRPQDAARLHWTVNGFPADSGIAARFWQSLVDAEVSGLAARNPDNHGRMGLTEEAATHLELEGDEESATLLVGSGGPRFGTTYVRLPGDDRVFALAADWGGQMSRSLEMWRSKRMVALDTASVGSIDVARDGEAYSLARADSVWTLADGTSADPPTVRNLLSELRDLQATGFVQPADSIAALPQGATVTVTSTDGRVLATLTLGDGTGDRWASVEGDSVVYRLTSFRSDRVAPPLERVRPSG